MTLMPHAPALALLGGLFAVLAAATLIGLTLERRFAASGPNPVIENLNARIRAWWVMVAVIGAAFLLGRAGVLALFGLASFFALREFATVTPTRRGDHGALALAFFVVLPVQYGLVGIAWYGLYSIFTRSTSSCCCRWPRRCAATPRASSSGSPRCSGG